MTFYILWCYDMRLTGDHGGMVDKVVMQLEPGGRRFEPNSGQLKIFVTKILTVVFMSPLQRKHHTKLKNWTTREEIRDWNSF